MSKQITVTVPDDIAERLAARKRQMNVSQVATAGLRIELDRFDRLDEMHRQDAQREAVEQERLAYQFRVIELEARLRALEARGQSGAVEAK